MEDFIQRVKKEMERQGLSECALARGAEVGRPYLHRVLKGQHTPTIEWAEKVATFLKFSVKVVVSK
jgi:ribosome-binding protein aMBF1 (putative translation factor)